MKSEVKDRFIMGILAVDLEWRGLGYSPILRNENYKLELSRA